MEEKTLEVASVDQVALAVGESDSQVFEDLTKQLKIFCSQAQRITFPAMYACNNSVLFICSYVIGSH